VVWVQVPSLSSSNDYVWAYWGNATATTPPAYATNGSVWIPQAFENLPSYDIVYHLKESGFPFADSTLQHTSTNGAAPSATNGIVGQAGTFNSSFLDAGIVNLGDAFTLSAWGNIDPSVHDIQAIWVNQTGGFGHDGFSMG